MVLLSERLPKITFLVGSIGLSKKTILRLKLFCRAEITSELNMRLCDDEIICGEQMGIVDVRVET